MAVTFEPEQTTETAGQPETNNDALNTTGEDELEQLLEEFFEDEGEPAKNQDTAKTNGGRFFEGGSVQYATAVSNAEVKDATTFCTTVAKSMDDKVAELADFVQGFIEDFKQELETPPVLEPVTQDKLEEINHVLQQNRIECRKKRCTC